MARTKLGALLVGALWILPGCGSSDSAHLFSGTSTGGAESDAQASRGGGSGKGGGGSGIGGAAGGGAGGASADASGTGGLGSGGLGSGGANGGPDASAGGTLGDGGPSSGGVSGNGADGGGPIACTTDQECASFQVGACERPVCNPTSGTCAPRPVSDGAPCDDGNGCTQTDTCAAGACVGANPLVCRPSDQCHVAGTCNQGTGQCDDPPIADGTACDDGLVCTAFDTCTAGVCGGTVTTCDDGVACTVDACSETAGGCTADPTGCPCSTSAQCDDGNACNGAETCDAGTRTCRTGTAIVCTSLTDDCNVGTCNSTTGACTATPKSDGTACDDGNACTQTDTCQGGSCTGVNPVVCVAPDACHSAGSCNAATGQCTNPPLADGTACSDGNFCTQTDTCQGGSCTGGNAVSCTAQDQCHAVGLCNPLDGLCTNPTKTNGTGCDDGNACTQTDTCQAGACAGASPVVCAAQDQCHAAGTCDTKTGQCGNPPVTDGTACNDANPCTQTDTCQAGVCKGGNAVVCSAQDQCHVAGTCDPSNGQCGNPQKSDGSTCNDANPCTQTDTCLAGSCKGSNPVVCTAQDQCHTAGTCNPLDGLCTSPAKANGTACDDGNACSQTDTCQSGACAGQNPVVCSAQDQCHVPGVCNTANGTCSNPQKSDASTCNDGLSCTKGDVCTTGVCGGSAVVCNDGITCTVDSCSESAGGCTADKSACGCQKDADCKDPNACNGVWTCNLATLTCKPGTPVDCTSLTNACNTGTCNPANGTCTAVPNTNGTACNDGNACTQSDSCQNGACKGGNPIVCTAQDQCHTVGTCNPANGTCGNPAKADNTACDDGNACTQTDSCQSGTCKGTNAVTCTAQDQCHNAGACNPGTGACSNPAKGNGSSCDDSDACTQSDSCQNGACTGSSPVVCTAVDQCHAAGTCNPGTGKCGNPPKPDSTPCNDRDACTQTDTCQSGTCSGSNLVVCTALDQCHGVGACIPLTGLCTNPSKGNGVTCDDGNACSQTDTCQSGKCTGGNLVTCTAQDQCHVAGACVPATGVCTNPAKGNGVSCSDGIACTPTDTCQAGVCTGADVCSVTITPSVLSLVPDDTFGFSAVVNGTANQAVTWSVDEGMPAGGVVDSSGAYIAPSALGTYHVTATSVADPAQSATATVTVTKTPVAVALCPQTTTLLTDDTMLYTAMVSGTGNQAVTWSVSGGSGGSITAGGLFTPGSAGTYTITAVSQAEPAKQATATATVVAQTLPSLSGAVSYAGAKKGRIYVIIQSFGGGTTTMLAPGKYRIRDVQLPNQLITVLAYRDTLGVGTYVPGVDPAGWATFTWTGTDPGNVNVTLVDPTPPALVAPTNAFVAVDSGLALVSAHITDSSNGELPDHYRVYVGLDAGVDASSNVMVRDYRAGGVGVAVLAPLTNGTPYWFAVAGVRGGVVGPTLTMGPYTPNPPVGGSSVTGTVDFTGVVHTGPLYVLALPNNGPPQVSRYTPSAGATSQAFTLSGVQDGVYQLIALFDQGDDGEIAPTDPGNFHTGSPLTFAVSGAPVTGLTASVTSADSLAVVTTEHDTDGVNDDYSLRFGVGPNMKLVTKVALTSGPGLGAPTDLPTADTRGHVGEFRWEPPSTPALPVVGGVYTFDVTYDDGVTCSVSTTVNTVLSGTPTAVAPLVTGGTTPTFSWLGPAPAPSVFTYALTIGPQGSSSSPLWQYGMPSTQTSVLFDVDGSASSPSLQSGTTYDWTISDLDPAGNQARYRASFTVP